VGIKITPDLFSDNPVADGIKMANSRGGVVKPTAQAEVVLTILFQSCPHRKKCHILFRTKTLQFRLDGLKGIVSRAKKLRRVDNEEPAPKGPFEAKNTGTRDARGLLIQARFVFLTGCPFYVTLLCEPDLEQCQAASQAEGEHGARSQST